MKFALQVVLILILLALTYFLGNLVPRTDFRTTAGIFVVLFGLMMLVFSLSGEKTSWFFILISGLLIRFSLFLAIPQWSEDYTRFLWDGELIRMQENPYGETPRQLLENHPQEATELLHQLYPLLNSPDYYSVYPPMNQAVFWLAAQASNGLIANGIISLRLLLILGEIAVFMLFVRIFKIFQKPVALLWLYWINPLVILEITGNLHFEGLVLLFLLGAILAFKNNLEALSGGLWGFSVGMKLVPLILIPTWFFFGKTQRNTLFWSGAVLALILSLGWFFLSISGANFMESLRLYQGKFEFNASIYYLFRELGFWIKGYNTIATLSKILSLLTLGVIVFLSWKKKPQSLPELVDLWVLVYLVYLILQPVVHPWYIIPAFGLSLLTHRNTFLVWTFAAIFSYQAYGNPGFKENYLFLLAEYSLVFSGIFLDYFLPKRKPETKP